MDSPPLPMTRPTVLLGTLIMVVVSSLRDPAFWPALDKGSRDRLRPGGGGALPEPTFWPLSCSSMVRSIDAIATSMAARLPVMVHRRNFPDCSAAGANCILVRLSASRRRMFSPWRPMTSPTQLEFIITVSV